MVDFLLYVHCAFSYDVWQ